MKKLWYILYTIGLCFVLALSVFLFQMKEEYDDIYLKYSHNLSVIIRDVDSDLSNEQLIMQLKQFSDQEHINLYRIIENANEVTAYNQDIFVNITELEQFKKTFRFDVHVDIKQLFTNTLPRDKFNDYIITKFKPFSALKNEGIVGHYYFETTPNNFNKVEQFLKKYKFNYRIVSDLENRTILEYLGTQPKFKPLIASLTLFLLIFIFVSFYEIFIRFKEIAIRQLLGNQNHQIISHLLKEKLMKVCLFFITYNIILIAYEFIIKQGKRWLDLLLFANMMQIIYAIIVFTIYIISLCTIYMVNINLMIKGKKSIKILNIYSYLALFAMSIIIMLLASFMLWMQSDIKVKLKQFETYQPLRQYATTLISYNNAISVKQLNASLQQFTLDKYDDMVLFEPGGYYMNIRNELQPQDMGTNYPTITINDNYFKNINQEILDETKIVHDSQTINIALPQNANYGDRQQWKNYIKKIYELDKVNFIYYNNQPIALLYGHITIGQESIYSGNIFVILTKENLKLNYFANREIYLSWYSQARMFIQSGENNYKNLFPYLVKYQLDKNIRNVSNVYQHNAREMYNFKLDLKIYKLSFIVMIFIVVNMIIFMTLTYLEDKKKQLAIYYVQGRPFLSRHSDYLLLNLVIVLMSYIVSSVVFKISWYVGSIYIVSEIICLLVIIISYQHKSIVATLKDG